MGLVYTFRFDDVSLNTNPEKLSAMIQFIRGTVRSKNLRFMLAVSPAVYDMRGLTEAQNRERTFPSRLHTESDFRVFYKVQRVGIPEFVASYQQDGAVIAAHGMAHVDHRLLKRSAQELSILMSCSLLRTAFFVPPFHKWNAKTEAICEANQIQLIKHDASWCHLGYHHFDTDTENYYLHTHDFDYQDFCARFS